MKVEKPDFQETEPYPSPVGGKNHGLPMIMMEVAADLFLTTDDEGLGHVGGMHAARVMNHFVRPERRLFLDFLTDNMKSCLPLPEHL